MHLSTCSFIHPFIHPFVHSSIRSFTQSFIHSFMLLVIYSFIHSSIHSLLLLSFIDLFLFVTPILNRCMNQAWRDVRTTWIVRPTVLCRTLNWICDTLHKSCTIHRPVYVKAFRWSGVMWHRLQMQMLMNRMIACFIFVPRYCAVPSWSSVCCANIHAMLCTTFRPHPLNCTLRKLWRMTGRHHALTYL